MTSILYSRQSGVATITLNEPEKRNPLNRKLVGEFIDALQRARADEEVSVVLLEAAGDSFCAGGDLKEFQTFRDKEVFDIYEEGRGTTELLTVLGSYRKPIVAACNGAAYGGGFGVVCACPLVVASEKARFGATELKLGLFPLVILPVMRKALGDRKALEMSLTAETIDAHAAQRVGIVTSVVAHDELPEKARAMAEKIASFSPYALKLGMEAFRASTTMEAGVAEEYMNALRVMFYHSEDLREGATAFLEKRLPQWRGR